MSILRALFRETWTLKLRQNWNKTELGKIEREICWTYLRGKKLVVEAMRMWKYSKFKDFVLFAEYYLKLPCYNSCLKMKQYFKVVIIILITSGA